MNFSEIEEVPFVGYYKGRSPFNGRMSIFPPFYIDSQISVHRKFKDG
jgi:hypothetical protein